jgi:hypothetical protein
MPLIGFQVIDLVDIGRKFRELLDDTQRPLSISIMMNYNRRRDCFDDALLRITVMKRAGQQILLSEMAASLLVDHPRCGMSQAELSDTVCKLAIGRGVVMGSA